MGGTEVTGEGVCIVCGDPDCFGPSGRHQPIPAAEPAPTTEGLASTKTDPLLVSGMRRWPTGEVRHMPTGGIGMSGMSTAGFLAEYDEALAEAYRKGFQDGYAVSAQDAERRGD